MVLRYMPGGVVFDVKSNFEVSTGEFYRSVWCKVNAIRNKYLTEVNMKDINCLRMLEKGLEIQS